jgi:SAM-dependent methyltransferase
MSKRNENPEAIAREIAAASPESGILSSPTALARAEGLSRARIRRIAVAGETRYQLETIKGTKAFHENLDAEGLARALESLVGARFARAEFSAERETISVLSNRRGELSAIRKPAKGAGRDLPAESADRAAASEGEATHNRAKRYILPEGTPVPFLVDLGVMTGDGKVVKAKYDKFRQVNRFLEFIEDVADDLVAATGKDAAGKPARELTVVDFGCGKSYLTFAIYHYLSAVRGFPVRIVGLDLKEDVIERCSALAVKYGYRGLEFAVGDIAGFRGLGRADMVVTLHACDTATDAALAQAVRWDASVILSVPCCQHELNGALSDAALESPAKDALKSAFRYGVVRERIAALLTDAMRAELLSSAGYRAQILEFIDMSHTPKNLLIRAVRQRDASPARESANRDYRAIRDFLGTAPVLETLLGADRNEGNR